MTRTLSILVVLTLAAGAACADSVTLKSGQTFNGEVLSDTPNQVVLKTAGGLMTFARDSVAQVKSNSLMRTEFQQRYAALVTKLCAGRIELAKWCLDHGMLQEAQKHFQWVLEYDANNAQAQVGLKDVLAKGRIQPVISLELELVDKSRIKGRTEKPFLTISNEYGELQIPLVKITSVTFSPKRGEDKIVTRDFPVTGDILDNRMKVATEMGEVSLDLDNVSQILTKTKLSSAFVADNLDAEIVNLREIGLDVMVVYDAGDSMESVLVALKGNMAKLVHCVQDRVPRVRMGFVAYRDSQKYNPDEFTYVTKLVSPLSTEFDKVYTAFLNEGVASGGDIPQAVLEGLRTAIEKAGWNPDARKVIILVGDAPPHKADDGLNKLYKVVEDWAASSKGFVHTIDTTGYGRHMEEFKEIAKRGNGTSIALAKEDQVGQFVASCILGPRWTEQITRAYMDAPTTDLIPPPPPPEVAPAP